MVPFIITFARVAQKMPGEFFNFAFGISVSQRAGLGLVCLTFCVCMCATRALGQGVLAPPPIDFSGIAPTARTTGTNQPGEMPPQAPPAPESPLLQLGPVQMRPHLLYRFLYGDGIQARPGDQVKTAINEIYPGIFLGLGSHWVLDYTPTLRYYSSDKFRDTLDHAVALNGASTYNRWNVGFSQSYTTSSQPLVETGSQTDQEMFLTALNATYQINSALSLELGASQDFNFVDQTVQGSALTDSRIWSTMDWLNYQFSPKLGAAIGVGFTYDNLSLGSDMISEQVQGRVIWRPGEKLSLTVSGGFEYRQVLDSDAPDLISPVFGLSAQYHVFEPTTLSIGASSVVNPSLYQNEVDETTTITASLHQRLLKRLFLDVSGGYTHISYRQTFSGFSISREDDGTFFNTRLSTTFLKRGTAAVFYQTSENTSSDSTFAFTSNQVGFELGYRF